MAEQKRILIVEDKAEWREDILREALENEGYHVKTSASYGEAVTTLNAGAFDLLVVDINLTGVSGNQDGLRIVERLAQMEKQTPVKTSVIVVSGAKTHDTARESVRKFGSIAFIDKTTFDITEFVETVADALN